MSNKARREQDKVEERMRQLQAARKEKYRNRYNNPDREPAHPDNR